MTIDQAAKIYAKVKPEIKKLEAEKDQAEDVLKAHFRKTGRSNYKGLIGYAKSFFTAIDTKALRADLGKKVEKYEVQRSRETLSVLK